MVDLIETAVDTPLGRISFSERGAGPVRLGLHSLLTDRRAFDQVAGEWGGRFISVDLPGFGSSEMAPPSIDEYSHRVAALIETIDLEGEDLTLIGNGLGAFVALGTAINHGQLVDRLLLIGCGAGFPDPAKDAFTKMTEAVRSGGMEAVIPIGLLRIFTESYLSEHPEMGEERAEVLRRTNTEAFVTACTALASLDYTGRAPSVTSPTLIVVGEDDQATPPQLAEDLHRLIAGSTLVTMPGMAHAPQLQDPIGLVDATQRFLEGR
ncbi:MAG TPA: alpha/beta fold hydrolase [Acidimicrobiia bacterium]|nr:alpha/beta fold hydrolase [Acidimicrobiia bacterium]